MSTVSSFDPRTGLPSGKIDETTPAEVDQLVRQAGRAGPELARTSPKTRRRWLHAVATTLEEHREELVALADSETALGTLRLTGEVARAADQLRFYGDVAVEGSFIDATVDEATATTPRLVRVNRPLGPVAVFGASNFPFAFSVLGNDTASALAVGCPVLIKAHPAHPLLSARLADLAMRALAATDAPQGTLGLVTGHEAGVALVRADAVSAVAFTGSQAGGMALWRLANERKVVIPVYAEMGTVNPVVVTRSAATDMADVARGFVASFTLGSGQFCTKPGLLLVPAGHDGAAQVGGALAEAAPRPVMLTESISRSLDQGLDELTAAGASVVHSEPGDGRGWSGRAAVLKASVEDIVQGSRILEECFGPTAVVVEYNTDDELRTVLSRLQGSLAASVITGYPDPDASWIIAQLASSAGRVAVNDWPTGVACTWAQQHGGPWPATSSPAHTSVGAGALHRFVRPVTFQSTPNAWLPPEAQDSNPWGLPRRINGAAAGRGGM
ncbi:aldehyde dehydrogenase family protein [Streptomyces sp. NPDC008343]|uniref:aldehyde dehydrogenase family protein n=1 Tax=Streptomyces sp. NPDC008343 TaxID=3364828 RepID=UPI0036EB7735